MEKAYKPGFIKSYAYLVPLHNLYNALTYLIPVLDIQRITPLCMLAMCIYKFVFRGYAIPKRELFYLRFFINTVQYRQQEQACRHVHRDDNSYNAHHLLTQFYKFKVFNV